MIIASAAAVVADAPSVAVAAYGAVAVAAAAAVIESASGARYQNLKISVRIYTFGYINNPVLLIRQTKIQT